MQAPNRAAISCHGKAPMTAIRAKEVAKDMRRRGRKKVDPYHCPHCGDWHVGSKVKRLPDARRAALERGKKDSEE